jgi:iron complex outermembrane receptor protein
MGSSVLRRACSIALAAGLATSVAHAQTPNEGDALEEITVTAQRRVENLQDVPISAAVLTGDMLAAKGVEGLYALQYAAPSLTVADYGSANVLNIRGVGRSAVDIELPSGVVLYRDGVPTFPGYFQNEPYYDIDAIEVLRGPQGTFVGKSAAGGAIFIRTAAPDLEKFGGRIEAEAGSFEQYGATAILNAPVSDEFGVRVAYRHMQRDEVLVDSVTGPFTGRPGRPRLDSFRFGAKWAPSDQLSLDTRIDVSDLDFGGNLTSSYGFPLYRPVQDANFEYEDKSVRAVANLRYTFANDLTLSAVSGYQRTRTVNNFDRNGSVTHIDRFDSEGVFKLWSQEFNLISSEDGPFAYVAGVFFQRTESEIFDVRRNGFNFTGEAGDLGGLVQGSAFPYLGLRTPYEKQEDEVSGFADFTYRVSDKLTTELGLRYSTYQLENHTDIVIGDGLSLPTLPFFAGEQELDEDDVDGKLTASWKLNDDHNLFALVSRAHVTGGFNIIGGAEFDKEIVWDYEMGWKGTWDEGRVRTQFGAYYQTLSKYQAQFASPDLGGQNLLQNATGKSKIYGLDASLQASLGAFRIDVATAWINSKLGDFPNVVSPFLPAPTPSDPRSNIISISGGETPFAPEFSFNLGSSYEFSLAGGLTVTPRVDYSYLSEQSGSLIVAPQTRLAARGLVNAGLRVEKGQWYGDLFGTNLADKRYVAGIQNLGSIWYPGAPRQYGIKVGVNF